MENIYNYIKTFIKDVLPDYVEEELPAIADKAIVFGSVDLSQYGQKVIVSVIPDSQSEDEGFISDTVTRNSFTVTFICQGEKYDTLIHRMCAYSKAFYTAVINNSNLKSDYINDTEIGERKFYLDLGTNDKQITAVEIALDVLTAEDYE